MAATALHPVARVTVATFYIMFTCLNKRKGSPYSITERGVPEIIPFIGR